MGLPQHVSEMSVQDYLDWEMEQQEKHEFFHGEVFAMAGASRRHVTVSGNVFSSLDQALEGGNCRVYMADMKLQAAPDSVYFYPDLFVTCDAADHLEDYAMNSPIVVVEVLSASTAAYDRGEKFAVYRKIPSLQEFVLIDPERKTIELFRRTPSDLWELHDIIPEQPLYLNSIKVEIGWARIFRNLE
ncbi:MAG: Uma2 family endonuclease [Desulfamplus sp.]|nr:Uma2 family endonuclease [Desulfamplus sp.]